MRYENIIIGITKERSLKHIGMNQVICDALQQEQHKSKVQMI